MTNKAKSADVAPDQDEACGREIMPVQRDDHGFDPADYKWVPVLRRQRADGWTPQRQRDFIAALAESCCVEHAAREVGMSANSCYWLRRSPGAENFRAAWNAALAHGSDRLIDLAYDRVFNGSDEPVFDKNGNRVGRRMRHNDRLHMFLLRAYHPELFRDSGQGRNRPQELSPPSCLPVEEAMRRLEPVPPANPHLLMAPDELNDALIVADALDGELPHWHRGQPDFPPETSRNEELEWQLEEAKGLPPIADGND
jgi:hypothetical protein